MMPVDLQLHTEGVSNKTCESRHTVAQYLQAQNMQVHANKCVTCNIKGHSLVEAPRIHAHIAVQSYEAGTAMTLSHLPLTDQCRVMVHKRAE